MRFLLVRFKFLKCIFFSFQTAGRFWFCLFSQGNLPPSEPGDAGRCFPAFSADRAKLRSGLWSRRQPGRGGRRPGHRPTGQPLKRSGIRTMAAAAVIVPLGVSSRCRCAATPVLSWRTVIILHPPLVRGGGPEAARRAHRLRGPVTDRCWVRVPGSVMGVFSVRTSSD